VAYFAAGIIDYDGTYVYALDATTGKIKWQNTTSGHLNKELRKGVSAQGTITILDDKLILAGGNQINPASFSLATGECLDTPRKHGRPQADSGQMVAVFKDKYVLYGGRLLYSAIEKVIHDSTYYFRGPRINTRFSAGRTAPVWNNDTLAYVHGVNGKLFACDADKMVEAFGRPNPPKPKNQPRWRWRPYIIWRLGKAEDPAQPGKKVRVNDWRWVAPHVLGEHVLGIAVAGNAILAAVEIPPADEGGKTTWMLYAFDSAKVTLPNNPKFAGKPKLLWQVQLPVVPLQDGLAVDRDGRVIVACHNGGVLCYGK